MLEFIGFLFFAIFGWMLAEIGRNMFEERKELKTRLALLRILNEEIKFNFDLASQEIKHDDTKLGEGQLIPFQIDFYQGSVSNLYFLEPDMFAKIQSHYTWIKAYKSSVEAFKEAVKLPGIQGESLDWIIKENSKARKSYLQDIHTNENLIMNPLRNSISQLESNIERFYPNKASIVWDSAKTLPDSMFKYVKSWRRKD